MGQNSIPEPGQNAPDFEGQAVTPELEFVRVKLSDYRGSWLALFFYPKDLTSGCSTEALEFSELAPQFAALNAKLLGVSKDDAATHKKFIAKLGLKTTHLADPDKLALSAYGAWRLKKQYGREALGTQRGSFLIGPDGVVRAAWPKLAKAAGHAAKVLEELAKLAG